MNPIRIATRSLARTPGFALTVTLTFALGVGLATAVFTVAETLLLRRLPVVDQERLAVLWGETRDGRFSNFPLGIEETKELARRSHVMAQVAFFAWEGASPRPIRGPDGVYQLNRALVSGNYFDVLGSHAAIGRALRPDDDVAGAAPVVVLSHRAWQQRFGGDSSVVGRAIVAHETGRALTIVGVMPQGLDYPRGADFWAPLVATSTGTGDSLHLTSPALDLLVQLRPGASMAEARAELTRFFARPEASGFVRGVRGVAHSLRDVTLGDARPAVILVAAAAGLLLLLTCVNVANLLLVRSTARVRELAVRAALGASRARILSQLLLESGLLALAGGALGFLFAAAALRVFVAAAPAGVPRLDEILVDLRVALSSVLVSGAAMLLSSVAPALFTSGVDAQEALRSGTRQSGSRRLRVATEGLVAAQIALAGVVLAAAGVVTKSLVRLQHVDLAFESEHMLVGTLSLEHQYDGERQQVALLDALLPRLERVPGVVAVSPVLSMPFVGTGGGIDGLLDLPGQTGEQKATRPILNMQIIAPNYFDAMGVRIVRGRAFTDSDTPGAPRAIIVSESAARYYWPNADAIGKRLSGAGFDFTVVGVVPDLRYRELRTSRPSVYFPLRQSFFPVVPLTLVIRTSTSGNPSALVRSLRSAVAELGGVSLGEVASLEALLEGPRAQPRFNAMLLAIFAIASVALAAIGLFAVIATMVRQRTRELGIRLALGATSSEVGRMVLLRGLRVAAVGATLGVAGALFVGRFVSALLFEVSPTDAQTLGAVALLLLLVATLASLLPVRASVRIDPVIALRSDA